MLSDRVLETIRFFDLQELPLTAFEVHNYLIADAENLKQRIDDHFELLPEQTPSTPAVHMDTVLHQLQQLLESGGIIEHRGHYALASRKHIIEARLRNYVHGIYRERLIERYLRLTKHIPFVRGIALAGSQALGQQRPTSDIDLFIITESRHMWLARTMFTVYFHVLGIRRYGKRIANRFCLNHYLANIREVDAERNLYKAMEYTKLRPVVYPQYITAFQQSNESWIKIFFPNVDFTSNVEVPQSLLQKWSEAIFGNRVGDWLEAKLAHLQLRRIKQSKFNFVREDELSFHPESKHEVLLKAFLTKV
ncbi:MAG: nucleotidyltransferase domain-containing protein [bacterium]|nr:nucleotidyltransferase domain-containing protein [bacterium]